jgi:hypothetical protein
MHTRQRGSAYKHKDAFRWQLVAESWVDNVSVIKTYNLIKQLNAAPPRPHVLEQYLVAGDIEH